MDNVKCPVCGSEFGEGTKCPECGYGKEVIVDEICADAEESVEPVQTKEEFCDEQVGPKADKKIKRATFVVAILLFISIGVFAWYTANMHNTINVAFFGADDISGVYTDDLYGMYFDFTNEETSAEFPIDVEADSSASSDAAANAKTEVRSFEGTYKTGYSDKYITSVIVNQYIQQKNMGEDYKTYLADNEIIHDDFLGFAKSKGITKEDIDSFELAATIRSEGESFTSEGYWNYDEDKREIILYSSGGKEQITLMVKKEGLVDSFNYMEGNPKRNSLFDSSFEMRIEEYKATQVMNTYKDGNIVMKIKYDDGKEDSYNGTYKVKDGIMVAEIEGNKFPYNVIDGALASGVFVR